MSDEEYRARSELYRNTIEPRIAYSWHPEISISSPAGPRGELRVLDACRFRKPGKYQLHAVYAPLGLSPRAPPTPLELQMSGLPAGTRAFVFTSNTEEFEVVP